MAKSEWGEWIKSNILEIIILILVLILVNNTFSKPAKEKVSEAQIVKEPAEVQERPTGEQLNQAQEIPARAEPKVEEKPPE